MSIYKYKDETESYLLTCLSVYAVRYYYELQKVNMITDRCARENVKNKLCAQVSKWIIEHI